MDWSLHRTFLAVLRERSLSGGARRLGLAQPTVRRQIAALERALGGEALFLRSAAGLIATPRAEALRGQAEAMEAAAESFAGTPPGR